MARAAAKAPVERKSITAEISFANWFAATTPALPGTAGIGPTKEDALARLRGEIRNRYPHAGYDVVEIINGL